MGDSESDLDSIFDLSDDEKEETAVTRESTTPKVVVGARHMNQMKELLELDKFQRKKEAKIRKRKARKNRKRQETGLGVVETLASKKLGKVEAEIVSYVDYRKLKKSKNEGASKPDQVSAGENLGTRKEVSMDQARFDVFKLGVSGLEKRAKEDAQTALAIRLGAKPASEKCIPYAELKEKRLKEKEEKLIQMEERKNAMAGVQKKAKGPAEKRKGVKKSKKKSKSDMKVGSFDGGMLKLSSKELSRLKGKK